MHKKFEKNPTKIKGSCQSGSKVVTHNSKSDLAFARLELVSYQFSSQLTATVDLCLIYLKLLVHKH